MQALGSPHNGPDATGNVLCLCPNCHLMFDAGAVVLGDDLSVIRDGDEHGSLRTHPRHVIDVGCVRRHRERWRQESRLRAPKWSRLPYFLVHLKPAVIT
ncbi:HNH endonuclease [Streptomyces collinus]|uniref:HNH endonuclease n=1 Tax=Streptomyces collinus TaxID=42684 RepID=UPI0033E1FF7A